MHLNKDRLQMGESGENATIQYLESNNKILKYYDLRNDETYWPRGIDFEALRHDNSAFYIETKTVKNNNKNISLQIYKIDTSKKDQQKPGWFYTSEAKYLFIYHEKEKVLYIFDFIKLRKWYEKERLLNIFQIKAFTENESKTYVSINVLIPFDLIKSIAKSVEQT